LKNKLKITGTASQRRRWQIAAAIVVIMAAGAIFKTISKRGNRNSDLRTFTVMRKDIEHKLHLTGRIVPVSAMVVTAPQNGRIVEINVQEGTQVKVDDLLFTMRLETRGQQDILSQREEVRRLELEVQSLTASIEDRRAVRELLASSALLKDENELEKRQVELKGARERLQIIEEDMGLRSKATRPQPSQAGKPGTDASLQKSGIVFIRAPRDGIVTLIDKRPGDFVSGNATVESDRTVMVIADMSQLVVRTRVLEADLRYVRVGLPVKVRLDAYPDAKYDGSVAHIGGQGRTDKTAGYTYFDVDISVDTNDPRALPEMNSTVELLFAKREKVLALPLSAVALLPDRAFVILPEDQKNAEIKETPVEIGLVSSEDVEILSGLKEGMEVAEIDFSKINLDEKGKAISKESRKKSDKF